MPKSIKTLDDFSGGLNLRSDSKDLEDYEYAASRNISNEATGKLTQSGGLKGSAFQPSLSNTVDDIETDDNTAPSQGYGMISFNMDTPFIDGITASFTDDFDTDDWTEDKSGNGSRVYDDSNDNYDLTTGTTAGSTYGGIKINKPGLFADGDLCWVYIEITAASNDHASSQLGSFKVYLGGDLVFYTPDMNPENWVGTNSGFVQIVAKWGSTDDYIHLRYYNALGATDKNITIDNFIIKKIPTTGSNNTAITTGTGKVVLHSSINDASYSSTKNLVCKYASGIMGSSFLDPNVDMTFDNGILKVQNKNEIMQWTQVDRTRTLVGGGSSTVRNIQQVNYGIGTGYTISGSYTMMFPTFTLSDENATTNMGSTGSSTYNGSHTLQYIHFSEEDINTDGSNNMLTAGGDPNRGVKIEFNNQGSGTDVADDMKKVWYLGASLLFDDEMQEGEITWETTSTDLTSATKMPDVKVLIRYAPFHGKEMWDPRITGFRIWMSESQAGGGDPLLLFEANLINMTYSLYGTSHLNYSLVLDESRINFLKMDVGSNALQLDTMPAIKFSELKGYGSTEAIYAAGKCSAIVGSNKYLGNFTQAGVTYEDQIIRSDILNHDIYPSNNFVEVAPNDGDEIVALMPFGEELLVFKKRTMYVLSGAAGADLTEVSLEADYPGLGILQASQACETEKGVAWINSAGLYLYDGDVSNLSELQIPEDNLRIKSDNAFDSIDESLGVAIGYDIEDKKLVYSTGSSNQNFMIYDFKTETFSPAFGTYGSAGSDIQTNFVQSTSIATNKTYLIYGSQTNGDDDLDIWHFDKDPVTSDTGDFLYVSKDMSFANPTTRKKVIGVYITYKCNGQSNVKPLYAKDSSRPADWGSVSEVFSDTLSHFVGTTTDGLHASNKDLNTTSNAWKTIYLKPASAVNNVYTFQFALISIGSVPSSFEINDISVVFREKSQK